MSQPPSIQASIAVMNTWVRFAPAINGRDSMTDPCMERTTYQRGAGVGSSGLKAARRRTMFRKYSVRRSGVHPVKGKTDYCMRRFRHTPRCGFLRADVPLRLAVPIARAQGLDLFCSLCRKRLLHLRL
jgi:hypothetical protein